MNLLMNNSNNNKKNLSRYRGNKNSKQQENENIFFIEGRINIRYMKQMMMIMMT